MEVSKLDVYKVSSLDVWAGDEVGEWDINDYFNVGTLELPESFSDAGLMCAMMQQGYLKDTIKLEGLGIHNYENGFIEVCDADDNWKPVYHLILMEA